MKVALDGRALTTERTGGGSYTYNLIKNIIKKDKCNHYLVCAHRVMDLDIASPNLSLKVNRYPLGFIWQNIALPHVLKRERVDIYHSPLFTAPLGIKCPSIITVFDLTTILFPRLHHWKVRMSLNHTLRSSLRRADRIIAISENTRTDILKVLNIKEEKVVVIYPGVSEAFTPPLPGDVKRIRKRYASGERYILHLGTLEPRKNLGFLLDAFSLFLKNHSGRRIKLLLAGPKGWGYKTIFDKIHRLGIQDKVIFCGYVPSADLPALYGAAESFVYPSIYEGFGLPPLEAMACGVPVITSRVSSLPEVVGDAGILIDTEDVSGLSDKIATLLENEALRKKMIELGLRQARKFSWERCAEQTLKLYHEVVR